MTTIKYPVAIVCTFLWIGFVCAISFMEAWLKFRAPGITVPLGLGIGRIVFSALNKVEWVFSIVILINFLFTSGYKFSLADIAYFIPVLLLIIQTAWLLPALDIRAQLHIQGETVPPSNLHFYYVGMETIKIICLVVFGTSLFKTT